MNTFCHSLLMGVLAALVWRVVELNHHSEIDMEIGADSAAASLGLPNYAGRYALLC